VKDEEYGAGEFTLQLTVLAEKYDLTDQDWVSKKVNNSMIINQKFLTVKCQATMHM